MDVSFHWLANLSTCGKRNGIILDMESGLPGWGRYSQIEREQRWLLKEAPGDMVDPVGIHDIYLRRTDLRLRRMDSPKGVTWKLGQKIRE